MPGKVRARKRAPKACLTCRRRKVRCDVSSRGQPCTNCQLDDEQCRVHDRRGRGTQPRIDAFGTGLVQSQLDSNENSQALPPPTVAVNLSPPMGHGQLYDLDPNTLVTLDHGTDEIEHTKTGHSSLDGITLSPNYQLSPRDPLMTGYSFLELKNISNVSSDDIHYLTSQGAFRIPVRQVLSEFIKQYFLYLHPLLPLLHETQFWTIFREESDASSKVSLLVVRAMLFTSCDYVSADVIDRIGIGSRREARVHFYRTARLLFHSGCESSPVAMSQSALLLSFWSTPFEGIRNPNTLWLRTAIHFAREAKANYHSTLVPMSKDQEQRINMLKRLWWCCIIRDRIMALATRRSIEITKHDFYISRPLPLCPTDLADEVECSPVYTPESKRCLLGILEQLVMLCGYLTDALSLVFTHNDCPLGQRPPDEKTTARAAKYRESLLNWHFQMKIRFAEFESTRSKARNSIHDSVILQMCLTELYYQSAQLAIYNYEIFQHVAALSIYKPWDRSLQAGKYLYQIREELQHADSCISEVFQRLARLRLLGHLPINALALIALPLVFQIIRSWLSSFGCSSLLGPHDIDMQSPTKQRKLQVLVEAIRISQTRYDGADYVNETVCHVVRLAQTTDPTPSEDVNRLGWCDLLISDPRKYLELVLTMDLALSHNSLPNDKDYPRNLHSFGNTNSLQPDIETSRSVLKNDDMILESLSHLQNTPSNLSNNQYEASCFNHPEEDHLQRTSLSSNIPHSSPLTRQLFFESEGLGDNSPSTPSPEPSSPFSMVQGPTLAQNLNVADSTTPTARPTALELDGLELFREYPDSQDPIQQLLEVNSLEFL